MGGKCTREPSDEEMKHWDAIESKMKAENVSQAGIDAFKNSYRVLVTGENTLIPESVVDPIDALDDIEKMTDIVEDPGLLGKTVILKLNGGLGTGMGLDKAKSLLEVTQGNSFLDLIAKQIGAMKTKFGKDDLKFMLMNSFSTSEDTKAALKKYEETLGKGDDLEFLQNKAPKVCKDGFAAVTCEASPKDEWCPPGHGDLYPAMKGSGALDTLVGKGFQYMFVSNSDNLGATMDLKILSYFAKSGAPFMMECADRTDADKKGGHLCKLKEGGKLLLRESAQADPNEEKEFQDVGKYKYFNTNNLWIDLTKLKAEMDKGPLPLPIITNDKTVIPTDKNSTPVIQLETAMGAAIQCFEGAIALRIPRSRFAPVKTTNDLVALRSDAYDLTDDFRLVLKGERNGVPPNIKLDGECKFTSAMEGRFPEGSPSLIGCEKLEVKGKVIFAKGVVIKGACVVINENKDEVKTLAAGEYTGEVKL